MVFLLAYIIEMSKKLFTKGAFLAPVPPVLVTCGDNQKTNVFTVAWTGTLNTTPTKTYISVRPERYSYDIIKRTGEFVINLPTAKLVRSIDFCGCRTGAKMNKWEKTGITAEPSVKVTAPSIKESPISIECKVTEVVPLGTHDMFIADVVAVNIAEEIIDRDGKVRMDLANLCAYAHGEYFALGKKLGSFGFSVKKKKKKKEYKKH